MSTFVSWTKRLAILPVISLTFAAAVFGNPSRVRLDRLPVSSQVTVKSDLIFEANTNYTALVGVANSFTCLLTHASTNFSRVINSGTTLSAVESGNSYFVVDKIQDDRTIIVGVYYYVELTTPDATKVSLRCLGPFIKNALDTYIYEENVPGREDIQCAKFGASGPYSAEHPKCILISDYKRPAFTDDVGPSLEFDPAAPVVIHAESQIDVK